MLRPPAPLRTTSGAARRPFSMEEPDTAARPRYVLPAPGSAGGGVQGAAPGLPSRYTIMALIEGRPGEVGVAMCSLDAMGAPFELISITEDGEYRQAVSLALTQEPAELVIPKSQADRPLFSRLREDVVEPARGSVQVVPIHRSFFDETSSSHAVSVSRSEGGPTPSTSRALALCALGALLRYVESIQQVSFADAPIQVVWRERSGHMYLDAETLACLEVLSNNRTGGNHGTLLSVLQKTKTPGGARLLRRTLASPLADVAAITARYNCVDELLASPDVYATLTTQLGRLGDLDSLMSQLTAVPRVSTPRTARTTITALLHLQRVLALAPTLVAALSTSEDPTLASAHAAFAAPQLGSMAEAVDTMLAPETDWTALTPCAAAAARIAECFFIKPRIDGTLDALRKIFIDLMADMDALVAGLRESWGIPTLKLTYTAARGYHLQLPAAAAAAPPAGAIQAVKNKTSIACSTEELSSLSSRAREAIYSMYALTDTLLGGLLDHVRAHMGLLSKVAAVVAELDLVTGFTALVLSAPDSAPYVRPNIAEEGPLVIVQGRHPAVEAVGAKSSSSSPFVPNDVYMGPGANVVLLTGPNSSGKSTFLKQTAVITIMAHIGCFVPAQHASLRLTGRICTRMGTADDMRANASTFLKEMKEAATILEAAKVVAPALGGGGGGTPAPKTASLFLIDELGRGTSNEDGIGIAWAVCEELLASDAFTLFVTHYHELAELATVYANVRAMSMAVAPAAHGGRGGSSGGLHFHYTVTEGASAQKEDYGLALAEMVGFPSALIADARALKRSLVNKLTRPSGWQAVAAAASTSVTPRKATSPGASQASSLIADGLVHSLDHVADFVSLSILGSGGDTGGAAAAPGSAARATGRPLTAAASGGPGTRWRNAGLPLSPPMRPGTATLLSAVSEAASVAGRLLVSPGPGGIGADSSVASSSNSAAAAGAASAVTSAAAAPSDRAALEAALSTITRHTRLMRWVADVLAHLTPLMCLPNIELAHLDEERVRELLATVQQRFADDPMTAVLLQEQRAGGGGGAGGPAPPRFHRFGGPKGRGFALPAAPASSIQALGGSTETAAAASVAGAVPSQAQLQRLALLQEGWGAAGAAAELPAAPAPATAADDNCWVPLSYEEGTALLGGATEVLLEDDGEEDGLQILPAERSPVDLLGSPSESPAAVSSHLQASVSPLRE